MLLDVSNRKLQLKLGAAQVTAPLQITVQYFDKIREADTTATIFLLSNGTSAVDILATPEDNTERHVVEIHVYNNDSAVQAVQIAILDGATERKLRTAVLNSGDTLHYNEYSGWSVERGNPEISGSLLRNYRLISGSSSALLSDDIVDVDASGGSLVFTFNPTILTIAGKAKEIELNRIDISLNIVSINNGSSVIRTLPIISSFNLRSDGTTLRIS